MTTNYSAEEIAQFTTWLGEARMALHKLMTSQQAVKLAYDGESVEYTPANRGDLEAWIRTLEARIGIRTSSRPRARKVIFR